MPRKPKGATTAPTLTPGQRLRAYRESHGLSQGQLAAKLGCSPKRVSDIERGDRTPSLDWWYAAAVTLEVSPHTLDPRLTQAV